MEARTLEDERYERTEQRIARLTLLIGGVAGGLAAILDAWRWGAGLVIGASLAWLNFRWLQEALDALKRVSITQAEAALPRVPVWTWIRFAGRYALIGVAVYVTFVSLKVPILSMLAGLCALGAATLAASVYEILRPAE